MAKNKPKELMMTARVVEIAGESFVLCFDDAVEELDVGDMVTVTIVRSEV